MAVLGDNELEDVLYQKVSDALKNKRGLREPKIEDVFTVKRYYLGPDDFEIVNYYKKKPISAFNPGALKKGDEVLLIPRLIFDFYVYASSAGLTTVKIDDLIEGNIQTPLKTKLILWPNHIWEQRGTEDPRAFDYNGKLGILYTPKGVYTDFRTGKRIVTDSLALAEYDDNYNIVRKGYFHVVKGDKKAIFSNRDSAVLKLSGSQATLVTRPVVKKTKLCWRADVDLEKLEMYADTMEVVFPPEKFESHIGWSTNAVKLSSNEYLVGWHGVKDDDQVYRDGIAVVDENGNLLGITNYILSTMPNPYEEYGDRPGTIFGNGLVLHKDLLIWLGGVGDSGIGVFIAELDKVLEKVKWVKG